MFGSKKKKKKKKKKMGRNGGGKKIGIGKVCVVVVVLMLCWMARWVGVIIFINELFQ